MRYRLIIDGEVLMEHNAFTKEDSVKIKGIAIILMLIHHCFLNADRYKGQEVIFAPFSEAVWNEWGLYFKICVALFVFTSAYGLTISFKNVNSDFNMPREKVVRIITARYIKLISAYMFVFMMLQLYSLVMQKGRYAYIYGSKPTGIIYMLIDMLGLADIIGTPTFIATFWYMGFAQMIIFGMPLFIAVYKRGGGILLAAVAFMAAYVPAYTYGEFQRYIICIASGIWCADKDFFAMLRNQPVFCSRIPPRAAKTARFAIYFLLLYEMERLREGDLKTVLLPVLDAVIPIVVIGFLIEFVNPIPLIGNVLNVLGRHSMNIFLVHNFIRIVWYYDFTYSFQYAGMIVSVLMGISLLVSVCIEWIKKLVHFNQAVDWVIKRILSGSA